MITISYNNTTNVSALLIPFCKNVEIKERITILAEEMNFSAMRVIDDFKAENKEVLAIYPGNMQKADKIYFIGLGAKPTAKSILEAFRHFTQQELQRLPETIGLDLVSGTNGNIPLAQVAEGAVNGIVLGTYESGLYQTSKKSVSQLFSFQGSIAIKCNKECLDEVKVGAGKGLAIAETQKKVFKLVNAPSNKLTPSQLGKEVTASGKEYNFKVTLYNEEQIKQLQLHALLAVSQGSASPSEFIVMEYLPEDLEKKLPIIGLVGKGVTFDTGGLSLKRSDNMHYMKSDMGGAAAVFGVMELTAKLKLPIHLVAVIPATENCVDAKSIKPGDVINSLSGKTIEIIDTDAEGRLILADGITYLNREYKPDVIIDIATLTGSCVQTLGYEAAGLFTNNDQLASQLLHAGESCGERLWRFPMWDEYNKDIRSDIADVKNFSGKPIAGAISAAKFLEYFIEGHSNWAHIDIAGVAFGDAEFFTQKTATAFGIRLILSYLEGLQK